MKRPDYVGVVEMQMRREDHVLLAKTEAKLHPANMCHARMLRFRTYTEDTRQVIDFFQQQGRVVEVEATRTRGTTHLL